MDVAMLLDKVNNFEHYISTSHNYKCLENLNISLNISAILAMKKVRSFEIDYFNKYEENGLASLGLQLILKYPPSNKWGILSRELVHLLKYWLGCITYRNVNWWPFLRNILKFIKEIYDKHSALPNILVEDITEYLLDLASNENTNILQKLDILYTLNIYCAVSNKQIRLAMRSNFEKYFMKLSLYISTCGNFPCQYAITETLMRWLIPRHNQDFRYTTAVKWFPLKYFSQKTIDVFLQLPWFDFSQDARDFLNTHNETGELITSVVCKKLCIGDFILIYNTERKYWLDLNLGGNCMSISIQSHILYQLGITNNKGIEHLIISEDDITRVQMICGTPRHVTISVTPVVTPKLYPSLINITDKKELHNIDIVICSDTNLEKLDRALKNIYKGKYQGTSGQRVEERNYKRSGYVSLFENGTRHSSNLTTPSPFTRIREQAAGLSDNFKEKLRQGISEICSVPSLFMVNDKGNGKKSIYEVNNKSNDIDINKTNIMNENVFNVINDSSNRESDIKNVNNVSSNKNARFEESCLLIASVNTSDRSTLSDIVERLSKRKDFDEENIVDLMIKEALENKLWETTDVAKVTSESLHENEIRKTRGVNKVISESLDENEIRETRDMVQVVSESLHENGKRKTRSVTKVISESLHENEIREARDMAQVVSESLRENEIRKTRGVAKVTSEGLHENEIRKIKVASKANTENIHEINEVIEDTPLRVDDKKKKDVQSAFTYDKETVDNFYRRHYGVLTGNIVSPKPARNVKETSTDTNDSFVVVATKKSDNENIEVQNDDINDVHILTKVNGFEDERVPSMKPIQNKNKKESAKKRSKVKDQATKKMLTRVMNKKPEQNTKRNSIKNENEQKVLNDTITRSENISKSDKTQKRIITRKNKTSADNLNLQEKQSENRKSPVPIILTRNKRKLFSSQILQNIDSPKKNLNLVDNETCLSYLNCKPRTSNSKTDVYKDIENRKFFRHNRRKLSVNGKPQFNRIDQTFDNLKNTIENNKDIKVVDTVGNINIYNFSSESSCSEINFKRGISVQKRNKTIPSTKTVKSSVKRGNKKITKRVNVDEKNDLKKKGQKNLSNYTLRFPIDLADEKMRQTTSEVLNTSLLIKKPQDELNKDPEPVLRKSPRFEVYTVPDVKVERKYHNRNIKNKPSVINNDNDKSESSLPELIIERELNERKSAPITPETFEKLKNIYFGPNDVTVNEINTELKNKNKKLPNVDEVVELAPNEAKANISKTSLKQLQNLKISTQDHLIINDANNSNKKHNISPIKDVSNKNDEIVEQIDISSVNISPISIDTYGITAHNRSNESPPSICQIYQKEESRDVDIEYESELRKKHYKLLENQLNQIYEKPQISNNSTPECLNDTRTMFVKKLNVQLTKMSFEDIESMTKSNGRNKSRDSEEQSPFVVAKNKSKTGHLRLVFSSRSSESSGKNLSTRSIKNTDKSSKEYICNPGDDFQDLKKPYRTRNKSKNASLAKTIDNTKIKSTIKKNRNKEHTFKVNNLKSTLIANKEENEIVVKSNISPVRLSFTTNSPVVQDAVSEIINKDNTISRQLRSNSTRIEENLNKTPDKESPVFRIGVMKKRNLIVDLNKTSDMSSSNQSSSEVIKVNLKRKATMNSDAKRKKIDLHASTSGKSSTKVQEWFVRNDSVSHNYGEINSITVDIFNDIIEKLETSFMEINCNTTQEFFDIYKKFNKKFDESMKNLDVYYTEESNTFFDEVKKLLKNLQVRKAKRTRKEREQLEQFLTDFMSSTIRKDTERKKFVTEMLKEDVLAMLENFKRKINA